MSERPLPPNDGWEPVRSNAGIIVGHTNGREFRPALQTCSKCGLTGAVIICSERGCPVNGGAAYS